METPQTPIVIADGAPSGRRQQWLLTAVVLAWPFVFFAERVWVFGGRYASIGNDFELLYYNYKAYLLDHLSQGRLPLWSPAEGAGFPFYCNPFAQAFYPLNLPLIALYAVNGGYTALDHQRFTVLGVSIFALGLFVWLRSLTLPTRAAVFAALVTSVSFKVAEILRFPNAAHTAAWYPWILWALTAVTLRPSTRGKLRAGVLVWVFCVCLLTGGYPYYAYYGLFLFPPYLALLLVPELARRVTGVAPMRPGLSALVMLAAACGALVLCGPYFYKMKALLAQTTDRAGGNFEYATEYVFSPLDSLGSLLFPPAAQAEGWFYFGISGLLLIFIFLAAPGPVGPRLVLPAWLAFVNNVTWVKHSLLFALLWTYLPFFSWLRVWGRLNIVLVPVLGWLLALAYAWFEGVVKSGDAVQRCRTGALLTAGYGLVLAAQLALLGKGIHDPYWLWYFTPLADPSDFVWSGAAAFIVILFALVLPSWWGGLRARPELLTAALVAVAALDLGPVSRRMWEGPDRDAQPRRRLDLARRNLSSFSVPRSDGPATLPLGARFSAGVVRNWYFGRYNRFLRLADSEPGPRQRLLGIDGGRKLFFTQRVRHASVEAFLRDADHFGYVFDVLAYDGDRLALIVRASMAGYVSFIDNWDPDWEAAIDGQPASIELLFGTFKAVRVASGTHRVDFTYRPKLWPPRHAG